MKRNSVLLLSVIVIGLTIAAAYFARIDRRPNLIVAIDAQKNLVSFNLNRNGTLNTHSLTKLLDASWEPANPQICGNKIVVETAKGLYLINKYGHFKYQLTLGQNYHNPSCSPDGEEIIFDRDGKIMATDKWGTAIWEANDGKIGDGTHALYAPNGMLAWSQPNGDLVVEGKFIASDAHAVNWIPDGSGIAFYRSHQVWIYYFQTGETRPIYGQDIAFNQEWSKAIYEVERTLWVQNTFIMDGTSPDRQSTDIIDFDSMYVVDWLKK